MFCMFVDVGVMVLIGMDGFVCQCCCQYKLFEYIELGYMWQFVGEFDVLVFLDIVECLSILQLIVVYMIYGVYQFGMEYEVGLLMFGKCVDFVVLECDLFEVG